MLAGDFNTNILKVICLRKLTVDTGVYGTSYPETIENDTLQWRWSLDGTRTLISIARHPVNITDSQTFIKGKLIYLISAINGINYTLNSENFQMIGIF